MRRPQGMLAFVAIWAGQLLSVLATFMTGFSLTLWMYKETQSATAMAAVGVAYNLPFLLMTPIAGVMVDRYNRKLMMMLSDLAGGLASLILLILFATGHIQFWHLFITAVINGLGNTFQWPAYSAAISTMVSKEQLSRVNGMMMLLEGGPAVLAPILAGALFTFIGLGGILAIDVMTFIVAVSVLLFVHIPQPPRSEEGQQAQGNLLAESVFGFKYIFSRPSLLGLQMIFFFCNLFTGIGMAVSAPMILARTNQNGVIYGSIQSAAGAAMIAGGILMSVWKGFKKRIHGVLLGWLIGSFFGLFLFGLGQNAWSWIAATMIGTVISAVVNPSNQAIWQSKVPPDIQGRVFATRRLIAWFSTPIAPLIGGILGDFVFEPAMRTSTSRLAPLLGGLVGTGPGAGMSLVIVFSGIAIVLVAASGYFIPAIREVETIVPDHDSLSGAVSEMTVSAN